MVFISLQKSLWEDFPSGPVVKNLPCNAGDAGLIPVWGTEIPQSAEQPSPSALEPALKDAPAATKTQGSNPPPQMYLHGLSRWH